MPVENLIFIDESGANLQMTPRYGRAYGKTRVISMAPYQRGHKISMIGAISIRKIEAAVFGEWSTDGELFNFFLSHHLQPILKKNHVVIMDNVSFHKNSLAEKIISDTGAQLMYLPPYHPELNPIEEMWSKIKITLRRMSARTIQTFKSAIKHAFEKVDQCDVSGWFSHAGY